MVAAWCLKKNWEIKKKKRKKISRKYEQLICEIRKLHSTAKKKIVEFLMLSFKDRGVSFLSVRLRLQPLKGIYIFFVLFFGYRFNFINGWSEIVYNNLFMFTCIVFCWSKRYPMKNVRPREHISPAPLSSTPNIFEPDLPFQRNEDF